MQWAATTAASVALILIEARLSDRLGVVEVTHSIDRGWIADAPFPTSAAIAAAAAFVAVTAPWLSRRWRRAN